MEVIASRSVMIRTRLGRTVGGSCMDPPFLFSLLPRVLRLSSSPHQDVRQLVHPRVSPSPSSYDRIRLRAVELTHASSHRPDTGLTLANRASAISRARQLWLVGCGLLAGPGPRRGRSRWSASQN